MLPALLLTLVLGAGGPQFGLRPVPLPPPPMLAFPAAEAPVISALSWAVYSVDQAAELGSKDPDLRLAPASITKLMTAILTVENLALSNPVTISAVADATPIGFVGQPDVRQGEGWIVRDLLAMMNHKAAEFGMTNTTFLNPNGLDTPEHLSTARDLVALGKAALDYPAVLQITRIKHISFDVAGRQLEVDATNRDLGVFPGLFGLKTGDTAAARQVLLSYTVTQHERIIAVVLGAPDRRTATREIVAWAMTALGPRDHFFALVAGTDLALSFPEWYQPRLGAGGGPGHRHPEPPERTPLTDDLEQRVRELLPDLGGGGPG